MFIFKIETIVVGYPVGMRLIHTYGDLIRVLYVDRQFDLTSCGHCRGVLFMSLSIYHL